MPSKPNYGDRSFAGGSLTVFNFKRYQTMADAVADTANVGFGYVVSVGLLFYNTDGAWVPVGQTGAPGPGVPAGGTTGQALLKQSNADLATFWGNVILPSQVGVANGVASLDSSGLVPASQIPPIAITNTFVVGSQAAQTALSAQVGDIAVRSDLNQTFILQGSDPSVFSNWVLLVGNYLTSFNGRAGPAITPLASDYTPAFIGAQVSSSELTALAGAGSLGYAYRTGAGAYSWSTTIPDSALSSNVALRNVDNNFLTSQSITGTLSATYAQLNISAGVPTQAEGLLFWDPTDHALSYWSDVTGSSCQLGYENWVRIVNKTGSTLADSSVVYLSGAQGNRPTATLAIATDMTSAHRTIGLMTDSTANNAEGLVTTFGVVHGVDTRGVAYGETWADGDPLYLSATVAGGLTNVRPPVPKHAIRVGYALNTTVNGSILVSVDLGGTLADQHDVLLTSPATGQYLRYNAAGPYWANSGLLASDLSGTIPAANMPAHTGDVTTVAGNLATTIAANAVTYGKMQAVSATSKLLGSSASTTAVQEITLGTGLSMTGSTLNAAAAGITALTGDVTASGSGSVAATIAAGAVTYAKVQSTSAASVLLGRGSSGAGSVQELTLGAGLSIVGAQLQLGTGSGSGIPTDSYDVMLLHMDDVGFTDAMGQRTLGGSTQATLNTSTFKFGSGSVLFGTPYGQLTYTPGVVATGDFTIQGWVYPTTIPGSADVFGFNLGSETTGRRSFGYNTAHGGFYTNVYGDGSYPAFGGATMSTGAWQHVAIVRQGSTVSCYLNGTLVGTLSLPGSMGNTGGFNVSGTQSYVDEVLYSIGIARYTAPFTPPTQPWTNVTASPYAVLANANNFTAASAASTPAELFSGAWYTAGNNTTNTPLVTPHVLVQPSAAAAGSWNAAGTGLGVNAPSGFAGALFDLQQNGTSQFRVNYNGTVMFNGTLVNTGNGYVAWYGTSPGTTTPGSDAVQFGGGILSVGRVLDSRGTLQVYSSATIGSSLSVGTTLAVNGITYTWPASNGTGVLTNNGSGTLTWAAASSGITALTGDVTASGSGSVAATIAVGAVTDAKASLADKPPVKVVSSTDIAVLSGTMTIDSVSVLAGDLVLLTAQTLAWKNGPWVASASTWTRPSWYPVGGTTQAFYGATFKVLQGTYWGGSTWYISTTGVITINTTNVTMTVSTLGGWLVSGSALLGLSNTWTNTNVYSVTSTALTPAVSLTGAWFSGGSSSTTTPHFLVQPSGATASSQWSVNGTGIGVNAAGTCNLMDLQTNGASKFMVDSTGYFSSAGGAGISGRSIFYGNGASSASSILLSGTWFSGGTGTTTKPQLLIETSGANSNNWFTTGTGLGINGYPGFTGNLIDAQVNGVRAFNVDYLGNTYHNGSILGVRGVSYTWPSANAAGSLTNDGSGNLSWAAGGVTLAGNNTWTGTNSWSNNMQFTSGAAYAYSNWGISWTTGGAVGSGNLSLIGALGSGSASSLSISSAAINSTAISFQNAVTTLFTGGRVYITGDDPGSKGAATVAIGGGAVRADKFYGDGSGLTGVSVSGAISRQWAGIAASSNITGTTSTAFSFPSGTVGSLTIPSGFGVVGKTLRLRGGLTLVAGATYANGTVDVSIAGVTFSMAMYQFLSGTYQAFIEADFTVVTAGATGSIFVVGKITMMTSAAANIMNIFNGTMSSVNLSGSVTIGINGRVNTTSGAPTFALLNPSLDIV